MINVYYKTNDRNIKYHIKLQVESFFDSIITFNI